ncbi:MAG: hypothetical protein GY940_14945 [bacterium]|nr:hypothetical protein [bacterium]
MVFVHLNMTETIHLEEISIDTKNLTVVTRLNIDFNHRVTGELLLNIDTIGFYNLKVGKKNEIQITGLKLYFSDPQALMILSSPPPPPGM